jgi:hypothetical protein
MEEGGCGMEQKHTLRYDVTPRGTVNFPPPRFDRKQALQWVTEHTNKNLGLTEAPGTAGPPGGPPLTDVEAAFLLYYLYNQGNAGARLTEVHILAPVGWPVDGKVACGYVVLRYLARQASAALLRRTNVELTASRSEPATSEAIETLCSEFGLESVRAEGGAAWTKRELDKVRVAMRWLPASHRVVLKGLRLVRVKVSADAREAGHFAWDTEGENRLELGDKTFERDDVRFSGTESFLPAGFVGGLQRVAPQSLQPLLHELGHAVEAYELRVQATALKKTSDDAHRKYRALFDESRALERQWSDARGRRSPDEAKLAAAWKAKDNAAEAAKLLFQEAESGYQKRAKEGSRRLSEFGEQVAAHNTPITSYAATSGKEFFAEAYAAWRADPEFLKANASAVFDWFEVLSTKQP